MARKSDWSQDSDTEWTFDRGGVTATIDLIEDEDSGYAEYHLEVFDDQDVVRSDWTATLEGAKRIVEAVVEEIV